MNDDKFQKDQLISYKLSNGYWYIGYYLYPRSYDCFEIRTQGGTFALSKSKENIEWCFGVSDKISEYSYV